MKTYPRICEIPRSYSSTKLFFPVAVLILLSLTQGCDYFTSSVTSLEPIPDSTEYILKDTPKFSGTIAFSYNNDIYLFDRSIAPKPYKITDNPEKKKGILALSYDKQKIAFLNEQGIPEIISSEGDVLEMASPSGPVKDLGWSPDGNTLYMLVNNSLEFHGPAIQVPALAPHFNFATVLSVHISQNLDLVYSYSNGNTTVASTILIDYKDPTREDERIHRCCMFVEHVRISYDGQMVLGAKFKERRSPRGRSNSVVYRDRFNSVSVASGGGDSFSPILLGRDSIIFGYGPHNTLDGVDAFSNLYLGKINGGNESKFLTFFQNTSESIYIDWKP